MVVAGVAAVGRNGRWGRPVAAKGQAVSAIKNEIYRKWHNKQCRRIGQRPSTALKEDLAAALGAAPNLTQWLTWLADLQTAQLTANQQALLSQLHQAIANLTPRSSADEDMANFFVNERELETAV